jgi:hypothetical protein
MKGDPKVIDYLNQSLRHEMTAVNQYWLHFRLLEDWSIDLLFLFVNVLGFRFFHYYFSFVVKFSFEPMSAVH